MYVPEGTSFLIVIIGGIAILFLKLKNWCVFYRLRSNNTPVQNINQDQNNLENGPVPCIPISFNIVQRNPIMVNSKGIVKNQT